MCVSLPLQWRIYCVVSCDVYPPLGPFGVVPQANPRPLVRHDHHLQLTPPSPTNALVLLVFNWHSLMHWCSLLDAISRAESVDWVSIHNRKGQLDYDHYCEYWKVSAGALVRVCSTNIPLLRTPQEPFRCPGCCDTTTLPPNLRFCFRNLRGVPGGCRGPIVQGMPGFLFNGFHRGHVGVAVRMRRGVPRCRRIVERELLVRR